MRESNNYVAVSNALIGTVSMTHAVVSQTLPIPLPNI